jgi:hypothetical protein
MDPASQEQAEHWNSEQNAGHWITHQARYDRMQWPGLRCHRPVACGVVEIGHRPVEREVIRKRDPLKSPFWFAHA